MRHPQGREVCEREQEGGAVGREREMDGSAMELVSHAHVGVMI